MVGGAAPFYAFSIHLPVRGSYVAAANAALDRLAPLVAGTPVVLGGDWNLTVGRRCETEPMSNRPGELELFDRLQEGFGLRSAWSMMYPDGPLPQTLRWARDPDPAFHCDGIFVPIEWASGVRAVQILDGEPWAKLSDHNPVMVEAEPFAQASPRQAS